MVQKKRDRKIFIAISIVVIILLSMSALLVVKAITDQPSKTTETVHKEPAATPNDAANTETQPTKKPEEKPVEPQLDPAKVASVAIEPMSLTVSYVKGVGGFDFQVLRTPSGTKYVQLSSEKLAGTKCTNDVGAFASIIEKPAADESATINKTTVVDGTPYGLSLADATCTPNPTLLKQYQDSFSQAFSLLKKM